MAGPFDGCSGSVHAALIWLRGGLRYGYLDGAPGWWVEDLKSLLAGIPEDEDQDDAGRVPASRG